MNQSDISKAWIEAGKRLAFDPMEFVPCLVCSQVNLIVQDVPIENAKKFERILRCPRCGSQNIFLMSKK